MSYCIYILECSNNTFYTGYTTDLHRRYQEHLDGSSKCKYTRSFPPVRIAASWDVGDELSLALKIEHAIKKLSRAKKLELIRQQDKLDIQDLIE